MALGTGEQQEKYPNRRLLRRCVPLLRRTRHRLARRATHKRGCCYCCCCCCCNVCCIAVCPRFVWELPRSNENSFEPGSEVGEVTATKTIYKEEGERERRAKTEHPLRPGAEPVQRSRLDGRSSVVASDCSGRRSTGGSVFTAQQQDGGCHIGGPPARSYNHVQHA